MPLLFGPLNSRYTYTGSRCPHTDLALKSDAKTLGEAIREYERHFNVEVRPCSAPLPGQSEVKYFTLTEAKNQFVHYVDIHVLRGEEEICTKQDLSFQLESSDLVDMGELVC